MSQQDDNIAMVRRYFEQGVSQGNNGVIDATVAKNYVSHHNDPVGLPPGPEGVKQFVAGTRSAFSEFKVTVGDIFAEGDKVAAWWTMQGINTGTFFGNPATGKPAAWQGVVILRVANGMIAEDWYSFDQLSLLMQLGAIPSPG